MERFGEEREETVSAEKHLKRLRVRDLKELALDRGVEVGELSRIVKEMAGEMFSYCAENDYSVGPELDVKMGFMYECYIASRGIDRDEAGGELKEILDSQDSLTQSLDTNIGEEAKINFSKRLGRFMKLAVDEQGKLEVYPFRRYVSDFEGRFGCEGEWLVLPSNDRTWSLEGVRESVVRELIEMQEGGDGLAELYHTTNNTVLGGVARLGGIYSSAKLDEMGEEVITGEVRNSQWFKSHANVFADVGPCWGYSFNTWFDNWQVTFGMMKEDILKYRTVERGEAAPYLGHHSEGIELGRDVPLKLVSHLYCESERLEELRKWAEVNAPQTKVYSLEAYSLWRSRTINCYYRNEVVDDWKKFLAGAKRISL